MNSFAFLKRSADEKKIPRAVDAQNRIESVTVFKRFKLWDVNCDKAAPLWDETV